MAVTWWGKTWKQKWKRCRLVHSLFLPGSLYVCPPTPSTSLPLALPQFPLKCQMQQLSASERGVPWWERAALLTWRPRLFSSPFLVFPIPLSQQMLCGCKGMSFFSPGHVNGLAQKHALILSGSGNSLHRKRLFLRAVFFILSSLFSFPLFFFVFKKEIGGEKKAERETGCILSFLLGCQRSP